MLEHDIFTIASSEDFEKRALEVFRFQYNNTFVYRQYCDLLKKKPSKIHRTKDIPFLPIQFFKSQKVIASEKTSEVTFTSSGTTGSITSKHHVADLGLYRKSFSEAFKNTYGDPSEYVILALLPSYLERDGSSLVYMAEHLIKASKHPYSGFYLNNYDALIKTVTELDSSGQKTILLGVSYALLDIIEKQSFKLKNTIIMETGGMKGKRREMVKEELHDILKSGFGVSQIHGEYGMTELLSQAYSKGNGLFTCPPWMKILTRDTEDPLTLINGRNGGINVIDLANLYSCSFIATQDLGKTHANGSFEILGRFDNSDVRGCNLMVL
ncbi:LuxE/PaaK family acyltransferase [Ulvibacter antarcticus]|uniref:Acyl-protein synthetase LuxE n=1 Tax=Ulvibacter antarcticus TaxID=442714 RepID=A0A3L9ZI09_9FLAO|nr:acyl transferase [Ulvibacter antarcticus]RMA66352.1 acyl-protein synthetase LuxE [Ulvibacter antarcticus]